jgi:hypothetical protein
MISKILESYLIKDCINLIDNYTKYTIHDFNNIMDDMIINMKQQKINENEFQIYIKNKKLSVKLSYKDFLKMPRNTEILCFIFERIKLLEYNLVSDLDKDKIQEMKKFIYEILKDYCYLQKRDYIIFNKFLIDLTGPMNNY